MKLIYPNIVDLYDGGPVQTSPSFPIQNILDPHITKPWKADATGLTEISLNVKAVGNIHDSAALFGLVADWVKLEIYSDEAMTTPNLLETTSQKNLKLMDRFGERQITQVWFDLTSRANSYIKVILGTTGTLNPVLGVVSVGEAVSFPNPTWGAAAGLQDHSIIKQLKNGSSFKRKKLTSKKLDCTLELPTTRAGISQYQELITFFERAHTEDFACLWAEGLQNSTGQSLDDDHLIWGSLGQDFKPVRGKYSLSTITFALQEGI